MVRATMSQFSWPRETLVSFASNAMDGYYHKRYDDMHDVRLTVYVCSDNCRR
jgi:hypothetical protein